tara:strand:- start:103 stop:795 length:693 start_codon:yes stop_codon:yes gene_type:complete
MKKKLEGLFGIKLGDVFEKKNFKWGKGILKKELSFGIWHIDIDWPRNHNPSFIEYSLMCREKDYVIEGISANTLSLFQFDEAEAKGRQEDLEKYFIYTYFDSYSIFYYNVEQSIHCYEFIPYSSKVIPLRKDYKNHADPNETSKELTFTIFEESEKNKKYNPLSFNKNQRIKILLKLKHENKDEEPDKIYEEEDIKKAKMVKIGETEYFDTGRRKKGYYKDYGLMDVSGL